MDKFSKMYEFVAKIKDLNHSEKQVLSRIYSWPEGCWESNASLGRLLDLHPRTIQKAIRVLREKGYIDYERRKNSRTATVNLRKAIEIELPLWALEAARKAAVKNLADKMARVASGHSTYGSKA